VVVFAKTFSSFYFKKLPPNNSAGFGIAPTSKSLKVEMRLFRQVGAKALFQTISYTINKQFLHSLQIT
jgi:hypothetical protein